MKPDTVTATHATHRIREYDRYVTFAQCPDHEPDDPAAYMRGAWWPGDGLVGQCGDPAHASLYERDLEIDPDHYAVLVPEDGGRYLLGTEPCPLPCQTDIAGVRVTVAYAGLESDDPNYGPGMGVRARYSVHLKASQCAGGWSHYSVDLRSGVAGRGPVNPDHDVPDCEVMTGTLLVFLEAAAESGEDGENSHLFPAIVRRWAEQNADEIAISRLEIEEPDMLAR